MAAAVTFYRLLGLEFPDGAESEGHVEATLPGGTRFMLDSEEVVKSFHESWTAPGSGGRIGLAFLCASAAEVDEAHRSIVAAGYRSNLEPFDAFWGQRYASVFDPDGNNVDLFAAL